MIGRRVAALFTLFVTGCSAPVRGEVVLFVDTDLRVPSDVDTLRVEIFSADGEPIDAREVVVASRDAWPVSFSLAAPDTIAAPTFRLRLSAFPASAVIDPLSDDLAVAALAEPACPDGVSEEPIAPLADPRVLPAKGSPLPQYTTGRTIELQVPAGEQVGRRVVLRASCLAAIPSAVLGETTCIDGAQGSPREGIDEVAPSDAPESAAGSAALVAQRGCVEANAPGLEGRRCVPGGLGHLGAPRVGQADLACLVCNVLPPVPVVVRPFLMDTHEVTVGRFSDAIHHPDAALRFVPSTPKILPSTSTPSSKCTWPSSATSEPVVDPALRALPLTCVRYELADELCRWAGGALPSEAQWSHVATGQGRGRLFPWGDLLPSCADPSAAGWPACGADPSFPFAVDAHPNDVSEEGIVGLASSVTEILADVPGAAARPGCRRSALRGLGFLAYVGGVRDDAPCVCAGAFQSPEIESDDARLAAHLVRGGAWGAPPSTSFRGVIHPTTIPSHFIGFRCVYPATPASAETQ